jgi:hypothetical protein
MKCLERFVSGKSEVVHRPFFKHSGNRVGASLYNDTIWTWCCSESSEYEAYVDKYESKSESAWQHVERYTAKASDGLWVYVAEGGESYSTLCFKISYVKVFAGLVCTVSVNENSLRPVIFSAFGIHQATFLHTEIKRDIFPVPSDSNMIFASWNKKNFMMIIPSSLYSVGILQIKPGGSWIWWDVQIVLNDSESARDPLPIRAACQVDCWIFALPSSGVALFRVDLRIDAPR